MHDLYAYTCMYYTCYGVYEPPLDQRVKQQIDKRQLNSVHLYVCAYFMDLKKLPATKIAHLYAITYISTHSCSHTYIHMIYIQTYFVLVLRFMLFIEHFLNELDDSETKSDFI